MKFPGMLVSQNPTPGILRQVPDPGTEEQLSAPLRLRGADAFDLSLGQARPAWGLSRASLEAQAPPLFFYAPFPSIL